VKERLNFSRLGFPSSKPTLSGMWDNLEEMKVHFMGIGGSGASAVASIAKERGFTVTGCDKDIDSDFLKEFKIEEIEQGHSVSHLKGVDILAVSPAIFSSDPENKELIKAREKGIMVMTWQKFMGEYLLKGKLVVSVCGTHGKSTTTAMVGVLLEEGGFDPTVELGAILPGWRKNFRIGVSKYFVVEADEFNDNFLSIEPEMAVVTSIEMDHPEYFKDFDSYKRSFRKFLSRAKVLIANMSDQVVREVVGSLKNKKVIDYSKNLIDFKIYVPGFYNKLNASAAYQVGLELGIKKEIIKKSLRGFKGIGRRFEYLGEFKGALVYIDFAHHPGAIQVVLQTMKEQFPEKKILVIFQPHMYSRTKTLFNEFVRVFRDADIEKIIILDIYKAREEPIPGVSSKKLVEMIDDLKVEYRQEAELEQSLIKREVFGEVLFFVGAGPINKIAQRLVRQKRGRN